MPEWYPLIRAARWLGVAPWDLAEQPSFWREAALESELAEGDANRYLQKKAERSQSRKQRRSGRRG